VSTLALALVIFCELCNIGGQLFFKLAMGHRWEHARGKAWSALGAGVAVMAASFFIWLGLLGRYDLSFLYPFEGLSRAMLLAAAAIFFREKITPALWLGLVLIGAGIALVASS
jgi:drug/metabolite transporter (DMT)-like permease